MVIILAYSREICENNRRKAFKFRYRGHPHGSRFQGIWEEKEGAQWEWDGIRSSEKFSPPLPKHSIPPFLSLVQALSHDLLPGRSQGATDLKLRTLV